MPRAGWSGMASGEHGSPAPLEMSAPPVFIKKGGWHRVGSMSGIVETANGPFSLVDWRYEKNLAGPG